MNNSTFKEFLVQNGQLGSTDLDRAYKVCESDGRRLDRTLLAMGLVEEKALLELLAEFLGLEFHSAVSDNEIDIDQINLLGHDYCAQNSVVPLLSDDGDLRLLISDPADRQLIDEVAFFSERKLCPIVVPQRVIRDLISVVKETTGPPLDGSNLNAPDIERFGAAEIEGPVVRYVTQVLADAVEAGASDIHFEMRESGMSLRFRVNGILIAQPTGASQEPKSVFARLKIISGMNVSERRIPQDGRIRQNLSGRPIDFRVSAIPTQFGESIVCRILDPKALLLGWDKLGFETGVETHLKRILENPSGLFLVTGPTGSGKTTTLYTALSHLNSVRRKIITVEDPIEYELSGIEQIQVNEAVGMTFARALRSILRQDPNVIMIGEIRDQETAEIACRAALIGRLVLSTLHTSSAKGAVTRMVDLGVPEYLIRDVLRAVLSQELTVENCSICAGSGCNQCNGSGAGQRKLATELLEF